MNGQDQTTDSPHQELQQIQREESVVVHRVFLAQFELNLWVYHCLDSNGLICHASCIPILDDNSHVILGPLPSLSFYRKKSRHGLKPELPIEHAQIPQTTVGLP